MDSICFFCKREFSEHNEGDIDNCLDNFKGVKRS